MNKSSPERVGFLRLSIAAALVPLLACQQTDAPPLPASALVKDRDPYRLGLGDKVRISIFGERDLSGEFQVSRTGTIAAPLVGEVPAKGLTAQELELALTEQYSKGFLKDPKVAVEVYDFRPYFVIGEVERPGRYPALEGTTLIGAIATAGGYTYRANKKAIFIRRSGDDREYQVDPDTALMVQPGDVIRVAERYF